MTSASAGLAPPPLGSAIHADPGRTIRVLFCCDPGYYQHLAVALVSMLRSNAANNMDVHLISSAPDTAAEFKLRQSLIAYRNFALSIHYWESHARLHTSFHISREAYTRLNAALILPPSIDKIIYLDCDLVVVASLADLWRTDIQGHALAAAPDPYGAGRREALGMPSAAPYVNSGVLVLNLDKWRQDDLSQRLAHYIEAAGSNLLFHDQDAINAVLHGATRVLPYRWNMQARMLRAAGRASLPDRAAIAAAAKSPAIIHYTSARKPWIFTMATPGEGLYRHYQQLTEWRDAPPVGKRLSAVPEYVANHLLYAVGADYTWDRVLRATTLGRILVRAARLVTPSRRA